MAHSMRAARDTTSTLSLVISMVNVEQVGPLCNACTADAACSASAKASMAVYCSETALVLPFCHAHGQPELQTHSSGCSCAWQLQQGSMCAGSLQHTAEL